MFSYYFILKSLALVAFCAGDFTSPVILPSWITDNEGFQNAVEVDSIKKGEGFISSKEKGSRGWKIFLNEKAGHGIEIELLLLKSNPDAEEFLLISPWPINEDVQQMQLFAGHFNKSSKKLRIPNTKTFLILFRTSLNSQSPEMALKYKRYGTSLEVDPPPTDIPVKKETIYEVQLKGKSPNEFSAAEFLIRVKEGLRASARRYCTAHKIPFNEDIKTEDMVLIHRISYCPFEWPESDICTSIEHSIFVSGISTPGEEFILNYQLTADHLKNMWSENNFQELNQLGLTIFRLPDPSNTALYWSLIIGLMIISSLVGCFVLWKANHAVENGSRRNSTTSYEVKKTKKPKLRLAKHQQVPSFMRKSPNDNRKDSITKIASEEVRLQQKADLRLKPDISELPIKNYFGGILFGINRGFEEEEENPAELQKKPPIK